MRSRRFIGLRNPCVHHGVLSQFNQVHNFTFYFIKISFNIIPQTTPSCLHLYSSGSFWLKRSTCLSISPWLHYIYVLLIIITITIAENPFWILVFRLLVAWQYSQGSSDWNSELPLLFSARGRGFVSSPERPDWLWSPPSLLLNEECSSFLRR